MSVKKSLIMCIAIFALILLIIFIIFLSNNANIRDKSESMIKKDQALLLDLNEMYAQGLQTGQATRNFLINPGDEKAKENYIKANNEFIKASDEAIKLSSGSILTQLQEVRELWQKDHLLKTQVQELVASGRIDEAKALLNNQETSLWREIKKMLFAIIEEQKSKFSKSLDEFNREMKKNTIIMTVLIVVALLCSFLLLPVLVRSIAKPLTELTEKVEQIAGGNLKVEIEDAGNNEIGKLSQSMKEMVISLNRVINSIIESADNVVSSVVVLKEKAETTTEQAENQSSQASHIATAAEEMSQTIMDIAKNTSIAAETSENAMAIAQSGKVVADGAVDTVNKVYSSTLQLATMVGRLNERTSEIGDIVTVINEIAEQTNLLALNAAIEAARAGDQGRGFAVVADEVRKLAERTISATMEISKKIEAVQKESSDTTKSMKDASTQVSKATDYIQQVGSSLNRIVDTVQTVKDQIIQIAAAVDQQSATSEEVARNIEGTFAISKDMEKMAIDMMSQVKTLTDISKTLKSSISGFRI